METGRKSFVETSVWSVSTNGCDTWQNGKGDVDLQENDKVELRRRKNNEQTLEDTLKRERVKLTGRVGRRNRNEYFPRKTPRGRSTTVLFETRKRTLS